MEKSIFELSDEQKAAVDIRRNIAVSAGAGSGKTRVLSNRFLSLLESGLNIEEIVAITFADKSALEMKERIRSAINKKIESVEDENKAMWKSALDKLSRANISTIHSFCAKIIRENAASLGIDFKFSILSDIHKNKILEEVGQKALEKFMNSVKYENIIDKLYELYGEEYFSSKIINELLEIREKIMEAGKKVEQVYNDFNEDYLTELLLSILLEIEDLYMEYKLNLDLLDYNDLENLCCVILQNPRVVSRYKERYIRFLVDEFQDTNRVQKNIIYSLVTDENKNLIPKSLFIVGDFKQSIYGFRGTNYSIFKEVSEDIGKDGMKSLSTCYRSESEIITGINEIFSKLINNYECLISPEEKCFKEKRLMLLTYKNKKSNSGGIIKEIKESIKNKTTSLEEFNDMLEELKKSYNNAKSENLISSNAVIRGIRRFLDKGLKFRDICILVRSKYIISDIEEELKKFNIPYCIIGGRGFYDKSEIREILNLYQVIQYGFDERIDSEKEKKLIRTLRSFIFNISDDLICKIKVDQLENNCCNYYKAMEFTIDGLKNVEDKEALNNVYKQLIGLIEVRDKVSVVQLLNSIIKECGIRETVLSQEGGLQKFINIEKLVHEAEKFDKEELFSPEEFLKYIDLLNEIHLEDAEASLDTEDAEAIKIMTIHQAKGLEFEGVIIPSIDADQLNMSRKEIKNHNFVFYNGKIVSKYSLDSSKETEEYKNYTDYKLLKEVEESIRVLYVALTRAKKYILMVGADTEEEPTGINEDKEKIDKLNTFLKQINYALKVGNADEQVIEFLNYEEISDMYKVQNIIKARERVNEKGLIKRLVFKSEVKSKNYVSASRYMRYTKCPRRFYIENVLNIKPNNYDLHKVSNAEFKEMQEEEVIGNIQNEYNDDKKLTNYVKASELGSLVHRVLEYRLNKINIDYNVLIHKAYISLFGEDNSLNERANLYKKVKRYIDNYKIIEKNRENLGDLVFCQGEVSYTLCPLDDKKTMIVGFIDRLEVFQKDNKYIAVITDYKTNHIDCDNIEKLVDLYSVQLNFYGKAVKDTFCIRGRKIDEINLNLYFLDVAFVRSVKFDEDLIMNKIKKMDIVFGRNLGELSIEPFEKTDVEQCKECDYSKLCLK
ncbi:MAG: helicase UvrD [Clostridiaceae bacterium]|nr:helicase UvrD [Clostridiaceae bacterium]